MTDESNMTESEVKKPVLKKKFKGIVHLKEWIKLSNGKMYNGIYGWITVLTAIEAAGFNPGDKEANWLVVVCEDESPSEDSDHITINGCQIRGFETLKYTHALDKDFAKVGMLG